MKYNKEQTARIHQMERRLRQAVKAAERLDKALDGWAEAQEAIAALDAYYGSETWRQDLADDEAGRLPEGLRRGVLSEDGVWNLLSDCRELNQRLQEISKNIKKT